jgi:hypothetical protein
LRRVSSNNAQWLESVVDRYGWPDSQLVGEDGAHAAWFLAQHADDRADFQRRCLALLELAADAGKADRRDVAHLADRVRVNAGEPQVFGTHWRYDGNDWQPLAPISDPGSVDERRRAMELDSLEENRHRMPDRPDPR